MRSVSPYPDSKCRVNPWTLKSSPVRSQRVIPGTHTPAITGPHSVSQTHRNQTIHVEAHLPVVLFLYCHVLTAHMYIVHVYTHTHHKPTQTYMPKHTHTCMHACIHTCTYAHTHTHTRTCDTHTCGVCAHVCLSTIILCVCMRAQ